MQTAFDCIPCFIRQALDAVRMATDNPSLHQQVLHGVLWRLSQMSLQQSPLVMAQYIHRLVRELAGEADPYRQVKQWANELAMELYPRLAAMVRRSDNALETALRLAIAGNVMDLGVQGCIEKQHVEEAITHALAAPFNGEVADLSEAISRARSILYLADNAGEIVFDRLLIEQLPSGCVTVAVRGKPVLNDATLADAEATGLTDLVEVIDNGSDAPGTLLDDCSETFCRRFDRADLVIAKGQGNYESLNDVERDVFFVLKAKCPVIAAGLGCPVGSLVVRCSSQPRGGKATVSTSPAEGDLCVGNGPGGQRSSVARRPGTRETLQ